MKYIAEYKKYVSTIGDPLEKLDDIETYMDALESSFDQIDGKHEMGLISNKEYKIQVKERDSFFKWCNEEMTSIKDQYSDLIDERSKKAWSGHKRLTFPVVWNRGSYNKIEPEIRIAGKKGEWIEWLLGNLTEGTDEYWTYEDRIINAAQLDMYYYLDFLEDSFSVSWSCSKINNNFVTFLFNVEKVLTLKTGASPKRSSRPNNPYEEKEFNELEKLILNTMKNRKEAGKELIWNFVLNDLHSNTKKGHTVIIRDIPASEDTMKPGILLYDDDLAIPTHQLLQSTFKKKLTSFRKLLLRK
jgi:hypothetical protein